MSAQRIVSFGVFEADLEARELRKGGVRVKLQQQPFRVLQMLLERPGKVVTRGKLQSELWSDDTFVEFDKNLSTAVQKIRQALGDSSTAPRYVETVPRVGYRFIAPVDARQDSPQDARPAPTRLRLAWALGGLLALLLVGAAFLWQRGPTPPERVLYDPKPLTSYPGQEINPELSPDGNQVAFAWDGGEGGNFDIYLKSVGPGEPVRLTNHPTDEYGPAWSPDGKFIAFTREQLMEERGEVMIIPALGGRERKVGENLTPADIPWRFMAWTPDSRWLIFTEPTSGTMESAGLVLVSVLNGEQRRLTSPSDQAGAPTMDLFPSVSLDGRWVAFIRNVSSNWNIFKIAVSPDPAPVGPALRLSADTGSYPMLPVWSAGGDSLIYSDRHSDGPDGLWRIDASGDHPPEPLRIEGVYAVVSARARRMVYQRGDSSSDIWKLELAGPGQAKAPPRRLIASSYRDVHSEYSPDGSRIVFTSYRSGSGEIWIADSDGSKPMQLTHIGGPQTGTSRWSPDGTQILFNSMIATNREAFLISPNGGEPRRATDHPSADAMGAWSADGKSFYMRSNRSGQDEMWKHALDGEPSTQITQGGARSGFASTDGKWMYYVKDHQLWRAPSEGGKGVWLADDIHSHKWRLDKGGAYYSPATQSELQGGNQVRYFDFATGESRLVVEVEGTVSPGMAVSPDGRSLLFSVRPPAGRDLMLVEGFE